MSGTGEDYPLDPQARGQLYHFLASAYLRPLAPEALHHLTDPGVLRELASVFGEKATATLRSFLPNADAQRCRDDLQQEFMDLFAVPAGRYVTPFEDVYRGVSPERQLGPLLGEHAVAVKRLYRAAGADADESCKELPTHIGVELAFMSFLCSSEAAARSGETRAAAGDAAAPCTFYRTLQLRFLREHLNAWFPQLCSAIRQRAASDFYRGIAELTEAVLERHIAWLASEPTPEVADVAAVH